MVLDEIHGRVPSERATAPPTHCSLLLWAAHKGTNGFPQEARREKRKKKEGKRRDDFCRTQKRCQNGCAAAGLHDINISLVPYGSQSCSNKELACSPTFGVPCPGKNQRLMMNGVLSFLPVRISAWESAHRWRRGTQKDDMKGMMTFSDTYFGRRHTGTHTHTHARQPFAEPARLGLADGSYCRLRRLLEGPSRLSLGPCCAPVAVGPCSKRGGHWGVETTGCPELLGELTLPARLLATSRRDFSARDRPGSTRQLHDCAK